MKRLATIIASLSLTGLAHAGTVAQAPVSQPVKPESALNYNTFEVDYLHTWFDVDHLDDGNGVGATFTINLIDHLYFAAGGAWEDISSDGLGTANFWNASTGLGGYISLTSNIDFVTEAGAVFYGYGDAPDNADNNEASFYVKPQFRGRWDRFEVHVGAAYANIDVTNEWAGFVDTYYTLCDNWDLALGVSAGDHEVTGNAGIRVRW